MEVAYFTLSDKHFMSIKHIFFFFLGGEAKAVLVPCKIIGSCIAFIETFFHCLVTEQLHNMLSFIVVNKETNDQ